MKKKNEEKSNRKNVSNDNFDYILLKVKKCLSV